MKINLAGYNIDSDVIEELKKAFPGRQDITPETLSAAYARISRDPRSIDELRAIARTEVEKSRRSNQSIIFGMGHSSVAEHAVFNFDVIGISRLAFEMLEHFRLASFTEKSQRYITLQDDYLIPDEIKSAQFQNEYESVIKLQNSFYHKAFSVLKAYVDKKHSDLAKDEKNKNLLEGWAKEDARYITSLATLGQAGMTVNARTLELIIRRFAASKIAEIREIGSSLYDKTKGIAPSVIKYTQPREYDLKTYDGIKKIIPKSVRSKPGTGKQPVSLIDHTKNGDNMLIASLLYISDKGSMTDCVKIASKLSTKAKKEIILAAFKHIEMFNVPVREFEMLNLTFDLVISASCFAQLKRHRLSSQIVSDYDPSLGITIPEAIIETKLDKEFRSIIERTESLFYKMSGLGAASQYILTNAHRRRVLMNVNARELYHISRLREDAHAQWDIRNITSDMTSLAKKKMPLTFTLIGGKDKYPDIYKNAFGSLPK